jgi:Spy/CpxP family protein refolding chaperone
MKQQIIVTFLTLSLTGLGAWGQQNEHEQFRKARTAMVGRGNWIGRRIASQEFMDQVGIQGEQAVKLKGELDALDKQAQKLDEDIDKAALEQAEVAKKVLAEPGANDNELMQHVERIGKLRTEQAKLATKRLIVFRDNLTPAQREKVSALLGEEQKRWREERETREKNAPPNKPAGQINNRPTAPKGW